MTSPRLLVVFILTLLPLAGACGGNSNMTTPPDTTLRTYDADDPNIQYTGRFDVTNAKQPKFALNATYVTAAFKGTGVSVLLKDEHRYGKWRNYYDAVVDGVVVAKIRPDDDISVIEYPVTSTLPYGDHVITLVKRTEPNVGAGFFVGFEFAGQIQPPPARPPHKMLFFGDSITAGSASRSPTRRTDRMPRACSTPTTTCWACRASASSATTAAIRRTTCGRCRWSTTCSFRS
jgi:hypothetical protein